MKSVVACAVGLFLIALAADAGAATIHHLALDRDPDGALNLNQAILQVDLSAYTPVALSFWHKDVNDEDDPLPASFVGSLPGDGVSFNVDGTNWHTLSSLGGTSNVYTMLSFDLSGAAASASVVLGSTVMIKFQQYDNFPFATDGRTFDDILLTGTATDVPEPTTFALLEIGLAAAVVRRRR